MKTRFDPSYLYQEYPDKRITLYDIRDELTNRFAEKRVPYHALTDEERFYLLCNETSEVRNKTPYSFSFVSFFTNFLVSILKFVLTDF